MRDHVRLVDVARRCNVAASTVSEILADPEDPRFLPETRQKVIAAARGLGYRPNIHARALLTGKSHVIGVACDWRLDIIGYGAVVAAQKLISRNAHHMLLGVTTDIAEWHDLVAHNRVDFLLALAGRHVAAQLSEWKAKLGQRMALVMGLDVPRPSGIRRCYTWNEADGARMGVEYLLKRGHRHIGVLRGDSPETYSKIIAVSQALERSGAPINIFGVENELDTLRAGRQMTAEALEKRPETTALFVRSSFLAHGVYAELRSRGLRIPQDISVLACYDHQDILCFDPPLTCVHFPVVEATTQALRDYFAGPSLKRPSSVHFECRLVERASVASQ